MKDKISNGLIAIDTDSAKLFEFTSDKFRVSSYLWRNGNTIVISFIAAKKKGAFCELMKKILECGFDFEIPTPSKRMSEIGAKQNWNSGTKYSEEFSEDIEILTNKLMEGVL